MKPRRLLLLLAAIIPFIGVAYARLIDASSSECGAITAGCFLIIIAIAVIALGDIIEID